MIGNNYTKTWLRDKKSSWDLKRNHNYDPKKIDIVYKIFKILKLLRLSPNYR